MASRGSFFFDDALDWTARRAAPETIARYLRDHANHADFAFLREPWRWRGNVSPVYAWSFREVSLDGLRLMQRLIDQLENEIDVVMDRGKWNESSRPYFVQTVQELKMTLAARIARVERHGTLVPPGGTISFRNTVYWETSDAGLDAVMDYLEANKAEHPAIAYAFKYAPTYLEGRTKHLGVFPLDALQVMERLVLRMEGELDAMLPAWTSEDRAAFAHQLDVLVQVIEQRITYLKMSGDTTGLWNPDIDKRRDLWAPAVTASGKEHGWQRMYRDWAEQRSRFPECDMKGFMARAAEFTNIMAPSATMEVFERVRDLDGQPTRQRVVVSRSTREVGIKYVDGIYANQILMFGKLDEDEDVWAWIQRNS